jgi:hypothetical protein
MQVNEIRREMDEFDYALSEYRQMVEFCPLVDDLVEAVLVQARSEEDDLRFSYARALGRITGLLPSILSITDVEERKEKIIQITKEKTNV